MEAVRISETSVYFNETTRRYNSEGCCLNGIDHLGDLDTYGMTIRLLSLF
jgi:hypothetical protein